MTNDKDMDVLIRRYAQGAAKGTPVEHPDADEVNAFVEGSLPAAARQRYVSHFADCDDCRKLVSQLAMAAGAGAESRIPASEAVAEPWWRKLSVLFAPATLRYAGFAAVLLAVLGVAFLVWRPTARQTLSERPGPELIAQHQPQASPAEAVKPPAIGDSNASRETRIDGADTTAGAQPTAAPVAGQKQPESPGDSPPPPPAKPTDALAAKEAPVVAGTTRADDAPRSESSPSYAPAPASEKSGGYDRSREQANVNVGPGGPRRNESSDKYKSIDRSRSGEVASNRDEDRNRAASQPTSTMNKKDDSEGRRAASRVADERGGARQEQKVEARKSEAERENSDEESQTRSAGGRKFKRQGNAWIDHKFKSSMSVRTVARGSDEFDKLDSGLRSIASQLSGEIVVVWKGKAYRIR